MKLKLTLNDGTVEYREENFIRNQKHERIIQVIGYGDYSYSELQLAELDGEVIFRKTGADMNN